ncbi:hypothetical protein FRX31_011081 [Thalictrum thalictroides]|uniref:DUF4219 domain-containing protein n=1 Tax=Thalictrum thalictroides TaxID=46969 RepID=A0A7J6WTI0_THATH|nr:hypothetical protein FRX31_011081 [Thalictrum thalictroides]
MGDDHDSFKSIGQTLDGTNYQVWAKMMKFFMIGKEVWDIVTGAFPEPVDEQKPDFVKKEDRLKTQTSHFSIPQTPTVLVASHHSSNRFRHPKSRGPQPNDECRYCHVKGHWTSNCPLLGKGDQPFQPRPPPSSQAPTTGSESALATLTSQIQELIDKHVGGTLTAASAMHQFANVPTTSSLLQTPDSSLIEADWDRP